MSCKHEKNQRIRASAGHWRSICSYPECWVTAFDPVPKPPVIPKPEDEPPHPGWVLRRTSFSHTYNTQPQAEFYARRSAEMTRDEFKAKGVDSEVRKVNPRVIKGHDWYGRPWSTTHADFQIWCEPKGMDLRMYGAWSVKEAVRQCWKRGVNPRVYWPTLEPGFEEKNGLDYFGGNTK